MTIGWPGAETPTLLSTPEYEARRQFAIKFNDLVDDDEKIIATASYRSNPYCHKCQSYKDVIEVLYYQKNKARICSDCMQYVIDNCDGVKQ